MTEFNATQSNHLMKWLFTLVIIPLLWLALYSSLGEKTIFLWLAGMALYIPAALFVGGKLTLGKTSFSKQTERLRYGVTILGKIEFGFFFLLAYILIYLLLFQRDVFWAE
jgi:hypothetical protein